MSSNDEIRKYDPATSAVFLKTKEKFGGLSNMASGFPLEINGVSIRTSEALYQACRFPLLPEVQKLIIAERSPMTAKMRSKPYRRETRPDWDTVRVRVMRWCLRVKLAQNWNAFGRLLLSTGDMPIVEKKVRRADFWGAKPADDGTLVGTNVLGRLLMELREQLKGEESDDLKVVEPLSIQDFLLYGKPIETIYARTPLEYPVDTPKSLSAPAPPGNSGELRQASLFEEASVEEPPIKPQSSRGNGREQPSMLKPHPSYRVCDLPWLESIPEHWDVRRNGRLFAERKEVGFPELPILEVSLKTGVRVRDMEDGGRKQTMSDRSKYKRALKGDVAYNMMRMWQGAFGVAPTEGLISPAYVVARPYSEVDPRYYAYLFRTGAYKREVNKFSRGIVADRNRLYWDDFKQMPSLFPPTDEQARIAVFLDAHGRKANGLVRRKRKLIVLLNEQKQTIVNDAVSCGLNATTELKETGIESLPRVPAFWSVARLKVFAKLNYGDSLPAEERVDGSVPVYGSNGPVGWHDAANTLGPCVIIGRKGSFGKVRYSSKPVYAIDTTYFVDRRSSLLNLRWLARVLSCLDLDAISKDAAVPGLDRDDVHRSYIAVPDEAEQTAIANFCDSETKQLEEAIAKVEHEIALIQEYRDRLVADVVTGKLDVTTIELPELDVMEDQFGIDELVHEDAFDDDVMVEAHAD